MITNERKRIGMIIGQYYVFNPVMRGHTSYCEGSFRTLEGAKRYIDGYDFKDRRVVQADSLHSITMSDINSGLMYPEVL